jgi:hypothetical protein
VKLDIIKLYEPVVSCRHGCRDTIQDDDKLIPRGFFTQAQPGRRIELLVVAQNPGHNPRCSPKYKGVKPRNRVQLQLDYVEVCFLKKGCGKVFHKRLLEWLCDLLSTRASKVFDRVVYTNFVKCSTDDNKLPGRETVNKCYESHLRREIETWRPKWIVALGRRTHRALKKTDLLVPLGFLPHPNHRQGRDYHKPHVERLRQAMRPLPAMTAVASACYCPPRLPPVYCRVPRKTSDGPRMALDDCAPCAPQG